MRAEGRGNEVLRSLAIEVTDHAHAEGAVHVSLGRTRVWCTASIEPRIPAFLRGKGSGWVHAEYGMLPRATQERTVREAARGRVGGRTMEIQRLISRSLRAVTQLEALGERSILIDCDVLQADGGTRTASIIGGFVAYALAVHQLMRRGVVTIPPLKAMVAAVSLGVVEGTLLLDLSYEEDAVADVDMTVVMTHSGDIVEVQGGAERHPMSPTMMPALLTVATTAIQSIAAQQRGVLGEAMQVMRR